MAVWPIKGSEAIRQCEVTRNDLRTRYRPVFRDIYIGKDDEVTPLVRARAASMATGAILAGFSAAAVVRTKFIDKDAPAEIVRADRHTPPGIIAHTWDLDDADVFVVSGMRLTTPARTAFDIGRTRPLLQAVPVLDALLRATVLKPADVLAIADARPGARGVRMLRRAIELADGKSESAQESCLRLLIIGAGLPKPETQIRFRTLGIRVDIGWRARKVAVEYDGIQHWDDPEQRAWDIERLALLEEAGWKIIRVSSEMLSRPLVILERIATALIAQGCPLTRIECGRYAYTAICICP